MFKVRWVGSWLIAMGIAAGGAPSMQAQQPRLDVEFRIPSVEGAAEPAFHAISMVALTSGGQEVVVLDQLRTSVRVFDRTGKLLREFGGRGSGPGQLGALLISTGGVVGSRLWVSDPRNRRVSQFDLNGKYLGDVPHPVVNEGRMLRRVQSVKPLRYNQFVLTTSTAYGLDKDGAGRPPDTSTRLLLVDADGDVRQVLSTFHPGVGYYLHRDRPGELGTNPLSFAGAGAVWALGGDSLVVTVESYAGAVRWLVVGRGNTRVLRTRALNLKARPVRIDREQRTAFLRSVGLTEGGVTWHDPEFESYFDAALIAANNDVWLQHYVPPRSRNPREGRVYTIVPFDPGTPVREVKLPTGMRLMTIRGDLLLGVQRDELDVQTVIAYRMR